ncbi:MAG: hypothetical protein IJR06_05840 [Paludibacteraceae bacterium]|nr:hypothetical protein [Paludibacteraceae bacterium]
MIQNFIKKLVNLTFVLLLLPVVSASAQYQLPNANFESWNRTWNDKPQPDSWYFANIHQTPLGMDLKFNVGERSTRAHTGSYSALCQGTEVGAAGIKEVSPSWITLGTPWTYIDGLDTGSATAGTSGGITWTARPDTMSVWIIRESATGEDMNLVYYAWTGTSTNTKYKNKNNGCQSHTENDEESDICYSFDGNECGSPTGNAVQVAQGWLRTKALYNNWTLVKVPIKYFNNSAPQKMNIILSASNYPHKRAKDGISTTSKLYVDDISLIYSSQIYEMRFNGMAYSKFKKDKYEYTYELTGDEMPVITCFRSDRQLSGSEISIQYGTKDGAPTTITVKAEDGSSTSTYKIYFVSKRDTNQYPTSIKVNGTELSGFNAYVSDYTVSLPYGTEQKPVIDVVKANNKQTVEISSYTIPGTAKVTVYAENTDYSVTYNIKFELKGLSDTTLKDILVNGVSIEGFSPTKTFYKVNVPVGTTGAQQITYVSAYPEGAQTIVVDSRDISETSTITVSAPEATSSRVYKISYNVTESAYSYLQDLKVGGVTIPGFAPATLSYTYPLPLGTTSVPAVTWTSGDNYQTITKEDGGIDGITKITVKAQNGINTSIYRISFPLTKSSNSKLSDLKVGGVTLPDFSADVTSYSYVLPVGTTELPAVTWTQGDDYQSVKAIYGGVNGTTKIIVTAQDGTVTTYSIAFSVTQASNSTLKDIKVGGVSIEGFMPEKTEYFIVLPRGTKTLPEITYTPYDELQKITKIEGGVNGVTRITVKAQSGDVTVYSLSFSVEKSNNALLQDLKVAGSTIEGFAPNKFSYDYELPAGTTVLPEISCTQGDEYQRVYITKGGVKGATTIRVVAEDGDENTYTINFYVQKSESANLKNIFIGGVALEGFIPDVYSYDYTLSASEATCPAITVEKDGNQEVVITKPQGAGAATIKVIPEEGAVNIYTINIFSAAGGNCDLADISVDGVTVEGFAPDKTEYDITLAKGTTVLPAITYVKGNDGQTVERRYGGVNGVTTISVMSAGGRFKAYYLNFSTEKSDVALLSDLKIDGVSIEGFSPDKYDYTYYVGKDATELPSIQPVKADASSRVDAVLPAVYGNANFYVTADNGVDKATYSVKFIPVADSNASLSDLKVDGVTIENFSPGVLDYVYEVASGYVPTVSYTRGTDTQKILLDKDSKKAIIKVLAEDGSEQQYTVTFKSILDNNALLSDLQVYDSSSNKFVSVEGFASDRFDYTVQLPITSTDFPAVNCVGVNERQTYLISYGKFSEPVAIKVTAEDGETTADYTITFEREKSSVSTLDELQVGGDMVEGFDPETLTYNIELEADETRGDISFVRTDAASLVTVRDNSYNTASTVTVTAEDGSETVYTLNFSTKAPVGENVLKALMVNEKLVSGFASDKFEYNVELYSNEIPDVTFVKNYELQTALVTTSEQGKSVITLKSNQDGVADVTYTINYTYALPYNVASTIKIDDVEIAGFDPYKTKYVIDVTSTPASVVAEMADGSDVNRTINNQNHVRFETPEKDGFAGVVYDLYFYYSDDVIPNNHFTEWTKPKYTVVSSAVKPVGWNCPADVVGEQDVHWSAALVCAGVRSGKAGYEISKESNTVVGVNTKTYQCALAGEIPAVLTLGNVSCHMDVAAQSETGFSGGITFRNTPDAVKLRYNYKSKANDGALFAVRFFEGGTEINKDILIENETSGYAEYTKQLELGDAHPTNMNIAINPNGNTWKGLTALNMAEVYVDYISFLYNSKISAITVNGEAASISGTTATATIDSEYIGLPDIKITGEVDDQMYRIDYDTEVDGVRTVSIVSYAENLSYTDYTLTITRAKSAETGLKSVMVDGVSVGLNDGQTEYTVTVPAGTRFIKNISVKGKSTYQTIQTSFADGAITVVSTAENGDSKTYTINVVETDYSKAALNNIEVDGYAIEFAADKTDYAVALMSGTVTMPHISYNKISDKQSVVLTEGGVNDMTSIKVTSADGDNELTYNIKFSVDPSAKTTSQLEGIEVLDAAVPVPFRQDVYEYEFDKAIEKVALINYNRAFAEDSMAVVVNSDSLVWNLSNKVSETEHEYKLRFTNRKSDNAKLSAIMVNGASYAEFDPAVTEYNITVGETDGLIVEPVLGEPEQTLESSVLMPDNALLAYQFTVTAANGNTLTYIVNLDREKNSDVTLNDITLGGAQVSGFDPAVTEYRVELPAGTTKLPEVYAFGAQSSQTLSMSVGSISDATTVNVNAGNGDEQTYVLSFTVALSDNALLSGISANYVPLPDFEPEKFEYSVDVPAGKEDPVITVDLGEPNQRVSAVLDGDKYKITVIAEAGNSQEYVVTFVRHMASGSDLADIKLDGVSIDGFEPTKYEYSVELPYGTETLPAIEAVMGDAGQDIVIITSSVEGDTEINVTSQDRQNSSRYVIHFSVAKSANCDLAMIFADGTEISGFAPDVTEYNFTLPVGVTAIPEITYTKGDDEQTVTKIADGTTVALEVKAGNGINTKTYTLNYTIVLSKDASLNMIYVNGDEVENFAKETLEYTVTLPLGTDITKVVVDYDKGTEWQTVEKVPFEGGVDLVVSAQDVEVKQTYRVNLNVEKSTNTALSDLMSGGKTVPDFDPETLDYSIVLPIGTKFIPDVTYVEGDEYQTIEKSVAADSLFFSVKVTAQNMDSRTYTVSYTKELSHDATLKSITLGDERQLIPQFDGDVLEYEVKLPYNAHSVPAISYEKNDDGQTVETSYTESLTGTSTIKVTAADGDTSNTYTIQFSLLPCDVTTLDMIYYNGKNVPDFLPEDNDYEVNLPYGTVDAPAVTFDLSEPEHQSASVVTTGTEGGWKSVISVKAESGDENEYTVIFTVQPDSETRLSDIKTFGKSIVGFNPEIESYSFELEAYSDSSLLPYPKDVEYIKMSDNEVVEISQPSRESVILKVTAPSGAVRNYVVKTTIRVSDNAQLDAVLYKDVVIDGFSPDIYDYTIKLPFGSNTVDKDLVTYKTQEPGQTVMVVKNNLDVELQVTAQDGETYQIYTIHFVPDDFDPTVVPTQNEVCVTSTVDGGWKFTTKCKNLTVIITDLAGRFLSIAELPSVDPNCEDICSPDAEGYVYYGVKNQVVTYNFLYAQKQRVLTGKLKCR